MTINKRLFFLAMLILSIFSICLIIKGHAMTKTSRFIVEIDPSIKYDPNIQVNYNNIEGTGGYHVMSRIQTLLYKGNTYEMQPQDDTPFVEYYIKNGEKYFYMGYEDLEYSPGFGATRPLKKDSNFYKLVINPTKDKIFFTNYKNGVKGGTREFEYSDKLGNNFFGEPVDLKLFTKFSLPKTSKFEPYMSDIQIAKLKMTSTDEFKKRHHIYLLERYAKKLNLNEDELKELRELELIKAD